MKRKRIGFSVRIVALALALLYAASQIYDYVELRGPVYTVEQVNRGLKTNPRAWVGRSVLVRSIVGDQGFTRDCSASTCRSTLFYEELGTANPLIVEIPWYHYPGALRLVAAENGQTIQVLPSPLRGLVDRILYPPVPRSAVVQRIRILPPSRCPTFASECPVAMLEH